MKLAIRNQFNAHVSSGRIGLQRLLHTCNNNAESIQTAKAVWVNDF